MYSHNRDETQSGLMLCHRVCEEQAVHTYNDEQTRKLASFSRLILQ